MAIDQTGDKSTRLGLLDEVAQEGCARTVGDRGAHRLPDGREATVEDPCAAKFVGVRDQTGPEAGERIEILVHEELEGDCETLRVNGDVKMYRRGGVKMYQGLGGSLSP